MAEPVISAADKRHRHSSPAMLSSLGKATVKTDGCGSEGRSENSMGAGEPKTEWELQTGRSRAGKKAGKRGAWGVGDGSEGQEQRHL